MGKNKVQAACRLCLSENGNLNYIFECRGSLGWTAADGIREFLRMQVSGDDVYPQRVCNECLGKLEDFKLFKEQCESTKELLDRTYSESNGNDEDKEMVEEEVLYDEDECTIIINEDLIKSGFKDPIIIRDFPTEELVDSYYIPVSTIDGDTVQTTGIGRNNKRSRASMTDSESDEDFNDNAHDLSYDSSNCIENERYKMSTDEVTILDSEGRVVDTVKSKRKTELERKSKDNEEFEVFNTSDASTDGIQQLRGNIGVLRSNCGVVRTYKGPVWTQEYVDDILRRKEQGESCRKIARSMGIAESTLRQRLQAWVRNLKKLKPNAVQDGETTEDQGETTSAAQDEQDMKSTWTFRKKERQLTLQEWEEIKRRKSNGETFRNISSVINMPLSTLRRKIREFVSRSKQAEDAVGDDEETVDFRDERLFDWSKQRSRERTLTEGEIQVINRMKADGATGPMIAATLGIPIRTLSKKLRTAGISLRKKDIVLQQKEETVGSDGKVLLFCLREGALLPEQQ